MINMLNKNVKIVDIHKDSSWNTDNARGMILGCTGKLLKVNKSTPNYGGGKGYYEVLIKPDIGTEIYNYIGGLDLFCIGVKLGEN